MPPPPGLNAPGLFLDDWIYTALRNQGFSDEQILNAPGLDDRRKLTKGGDLIAQGAAPEDPRLKRATQIIRGAGQAVPFLNSDILYIDDYIFEALLQRGVSPDVLRDMGVISISTRFDEYLRTGKLPPAGGQIAAAQEDPRLKRVLGQLSTAPNVGKDVQKESATARLRQSLNKMGLPGLMGQAKAFLNQGLSVEQILLRLEETPQFEKRFPALISLRERAAGGERGLDIPTPGEYIDFEAGIKDLYERAGLPLRLLSKNRITEMLESQQSLVEIGDRINNIWLAVNEMPREVKQDFEELFGVRDAPFALAATIVDPENSLPELEAGLRQAQVSGTGRRFGFTDFDAQRISTFGLSPLGLADQFQRANEARHLMAPTGGGRLSERQLVNAQFGIGNASRRLNQVVQTRVGRFSARGGGAGSVSGGLASGRRA